MCNNGGWNECDGVCGTSRYIFTQKWSEDLEWVKTYTIDEQRKYIISASVANRDI